MSHIANPDTSGVNRRKSKSKNQNAKLQRKNQKFSLSVHYERISGKRRSGEQRIRLRESGEQEIRKDSPDNPIL
jgi:hypothetical protein